MNEKHTRSVVTLRQWGGSFVYAMMHLLVDGLCVCCLYMMSGTHDFDTLPAVFITYTVLAFLSQPVTGLLADSVRHNGNILMLSAVALLSMAVCVATVGSMFATQHNAFLFVAAILLGMGNSLFHVWGGKRVACLTDNDIRTLGVYVATGAMGLAIGFVFASWWLLYAMLFALALSALAAIRIAASDSSSRNDSYDHPSVSTWWVWGAALLLMAFVGLRSFLGECLTSQVPKGTGMILLIGAVAMLGKALGGWVAKGVGLWVTLIVALVGALACLWLTDRVEWLWMAGVILINLTMAVTLYWCNLTMPGREGLAFGLLAASLMPGYLLAQIPDATIHLPQLALNLALTVGVEMGVLWLLREKRPDVLGSAVVINILTNIPLNLCIIYIDGGWGAIAIGEVLVVLAETVWYRFFTSSWKQGAIYGILCNVISFLVGLLAFLLTLLLETT